MVTWSRSKSVGDVDSLRFDYKRKTKQQRNKNNNQCLVDQGGNTVRIKSPQGTFWLPSDCLFRRHARNGFFRCRAADGPSAVYAAQPRVAF
jgi:hypothetical protein